MSPPGTSFAAAAAASGYPLERPVPGVAGVLLDALVLFDPAGAPPALLAASADGPGRATLTVGPFGGAPAATATFDPADPRPDLELRTPGGAYAGVLVVDPARASALALPPGGAGVRFVPAATAAAVPGVRTVGDGAVRLGGVVRLVGERGVSLSSPSPGLVRVDVIGDPVAAAEEECRPAEVPPPPVRRVAGAVPRRGDVPLSAANVPGAALRVLRTGRSELTVTLAGGE